MKPENKRLAASMNFFLFGIGTEGNGPARFDSKIRAGLDEIIARTASAETTEGTERDEAAR